jgi:hypothetical protein
MNLLGWYANFEASFMENILMGCVCVWKNVEKRKRKFAENKTQIMQQILKMKLISLLSKYVKGISRTLSCAFTYANINYLKVKPNF